MPSLPAQERLQPALLDRLIDESPRGPIEPPERRFITTAILRVAVIRDLSWLLNTTRPSGLDDSPEIAGSVLGYGLPALSGRQVSKLDLTELSEELRQTIIRFEPRLDPQSVEVKPVRAKRPHRTQNRVEFEIRANLWSQPVPLEFIARTMIDLEAGNVRVRDMQPSVAAAGGGA